VIYLLGGPMRVGKSIIAQRVVELAPVSEVSTDDLRRMLRAAIPEHPMHADMDPTERYALMEPFLEGLIDVRLQRGAPVLIEGDAFSPAWAAALRDRQPDRVRVCFAGEISIAPPIKARRLREHAHEHGGWLVEATPETYSWVLKRIFAISRENKAVCDVLDIPFFDMGANFEASVERVAQYLTTGASEWLAQAS
jgi:predicted kinase